MTTINNLTQIPVTEIQFMLRQRSNKLKRMSDDSYKQIASTAFNIPTKKVNDSTLALIKNIAICLFFVDKMRCRGIHYT